MSAPGRFLPARRGCTAHLAHCAGALWASAFSALIILTSPALAEDLPADPGAPRTVAMFDTFCFGLLPDIDTIAGIADQHFDEITGEELERYQSEAPADRIEAWKFLDFDAEYVLVITEGQPDEQFRTDFPDFAAATSYACTLMLPGRAPQAEIGKEMAALLDREADETWSAGSLAASQWNGQTETLMVNVFHFGPQDGSPGGLLSAVTFVLPEQ